MSDKYFFDSCMFIEYSKNNLQAIGIWQKIDDLSAVIVINPIVFDEVAFIMQKYGKISIDEIKEKLFAFEMFPIDKQICDEAVNCIKKYNLKMHDAFILATCKYYQIPNLVSLDSHFIEPCKAENINLINN
jgi:predicted nucleic acid-binding protein